MLFNRLLKNERLNNIYIANLKYLNTGIIIKKMTWIIISLLFFFVIIIFIYKYTLLVNTNNNPNFPSPINPSLKANIIVCTTPIPGISNNIDIDDINYIDSEGLTARQKADAINITLNDNMMKNIICRYNDIKLKRIVYAEPSSLFYDKSGYINNSGLYVKVPFDIQMTEKNENETIHDYKSLIATVNLTNGKIMSLMMYDMRYNPISGSITIPPNSYWYQLLTSWIMEYHVNTTFEPKDAKLYPIMLNWTNFEKFRNGSSFSALKYTDNRLNKTYLLDGNIPIESGWSNNVTYSPYEDMLIKSGQSNVVVPINESAILIINNGNNVRDVQINITFRSSVTF